MNSRARAKNNTFSVYALKFPLADSPALGNWSESISLVAHSQVIDIRIFTLTTQLWAVSEISKSDCENKQDLTIEQSS